ncbi:XapX domain-containing protein [Orenia metallireducens]|jgi:XapX domain-containing protein|uniref:XapX domain-containing protein n=1 Tax=Orenia metallireducens TaxID=1413210 RepID=A0A1C0A6A5_9FIRM|nr:XapX domain-containing protein [Orenia metallireducens]OCL25675.1 XapX domain-containing protein [Orenia metallireducens]
MNQMLMATISGLIVGALFGFLNLPIPAPPNLAGVLGIIGIYIGFILIKSFT